MKLLIFNFLTREFITSVDVPKLDSLFHLERVLTPYQRETDILGLGANCEIANVGVKEFGRKGSILDSMSHENVFQRQTGTYSTIYGVVDKPYKEPDFLTIRKDGKEETTNLKLGFIAYEEGWVMNTGKKTTSIFGYSNPAYLKSIGTRNFHGGSLSDCRIFKDKKSLLNYIKKNESSLKYLVKTYGYEWTIEPTNSYFAEDYKEMLNTLSAKKKEKELSLDKELSEFIILLNTIEEEVEEDYPLPSMPITEEMVKDEAIERMKRMNLYSKIINDFKNTGKIYFSEFGGVLYDLDEEAQKVVEECKSLGCIPYHVVKTTTTFGRLIQVLYVSREIDSWNEERRQRDDYMMNYCYNASENFAEFGESKFESANGGLVRTA